MAYFPNGTDGRFFQSKWCSRCVHNQDTDHNCPVWFVHLLYNYDQIDNEDLKSCLNKLITTRETGLHADECKMFVPITGVD